MKNRKLLSLILILLLTGCANKPTVTSEESSTPTVTSISEDISSTSTEETTTEDPITSEDPVTSEDPISSENPITSEPAFGGYYEGYDLTKTGTDLKNEIKRRIDTGFSGIGYNWWPVENADEDPNNSSNVIQIYSRISIAKNKHVSGSTGWNREHVVPKSKLGCSAGGSANACSDYHNLWAADNKLNSIRGNSTFQVVTNGNYAVDSLGVRSDCKYTSSAFEPCDAAKGEVARVTFYMIIKYNLNVNINGNLSLLLEWNNQFPPLEDREAKRNNAIQNAQGNRNPFIDYPELADAIWA